MKNFSCSFSKVCLFSLFVGSLLIFGCGESNPSGITTDDTSTSTTTTTTTSNSANAVEASPCRVYGQVISADDTNVKSPANIKVAFKNIATNVITDNSGNSPDTRDAFDFNLVAGFYQITAQDISANPEYDTNWFYKEISENQEVKISLQPKTTTVSTIPKINLYGVIKDMSGHDVTFANISAKKGSSAIETTTKLDNGNYCFLNLSSGTYEVEISKKSFQTVTRQLVIGNESITFNGNTITDFTNTTAFTDSAGNANTGYDLGILYLPYELRDAGAFAGVVIDPATGQPLANTTISLWISYVGSQLQAAPELILPSFNTDANGYFYVENLQVGYYKITKVNPTLNSIEYDAQGNVLSYWEFAKDDSYCGWLKVDEGKLTPLPTSD